jgi:hypothetical protein
LNSVYLLKSKPAAFGDPFFGVRAFSVNFTKRRIAALSDGMMNDFSQYKIYKPPTNRSPKLCYSSGANMPANTDHLIQQTRQFFMYIVHPSVICDPPFLSVFIHGFHWFICSSVIDDRWLYLSRRRNTTPIIDRAFKKAWRLARFLMSRWTHPNTPQYTLIPESALRESVLVHIICVTCLYCYFIYRV